MRKKLNQFILCLLLIVGTSQAQTITYGKIENPKNFMKYWELNDDDFDTYQNYMEYAGKFRHNHLNPLVVLSIISEKPEDKGYFAKRAAEYEHQISKYEILSAWLISTEMEAQGYVRIMDKFAQDLVTTLPGFSPNTEPTDKSWMEGDALMLTINDDCTTKSCIAQFVPMIKKLKLAKNNEVYLINKTKQPLADDTRLTIEGIEKVVNYRGYDPIEHHFLKEINNRIVHVRNNKIVEVL